MNTKQQTALAASALAVGAALLARGLRSGRAIHFHNRSVVITGGSRGLGLLIGRELGRGGARGPRAARGQAELERARQDPASRNIDRSTGQCAVADPARAVR